MLEIKLFNVFSFMLTILNPPSYYMCCLIPQIHTSRLVHIHTACSRFIQQFSSRTFLSYKTYYSVRICEKICPKDFDGVIPCVITITLLKSPCANDVVVMDLICSATVHSKCRSLGIHGCSMNLTSEKQWICERTSMFWISFCSLLCPFHSISLANEMVWYNALKVQTQLDN